MRALGLDRNLATFLKRIASDNGGYQAMVSHAAKFRRPHFRLGSTAPMYESRVIRPQQHG